MMDKRFIELGLIMVMDHCEVKDGLEVERDVAGNVELEVLGFKVAADVIHTLAVGLNCNITDITQ